MADAPHPPVTAKKPPRNRPRNHAHKPKRNYARADTTRKSLVPHVEHQAHPSARDEPHQT